jgi:20S proteasome subunit beta 1
MIMQTTIMAASYKDGVIMCADSRTSTGSYIANRVTDKITPLTDKIYICRSGSAADTQNLSRYVQWFLDQHQMELGEESDVLTAAKLAQAMAYQNKNMLQAGLIVAGWDKYNGGSVYAIPLGGTLVKVPFAIGGSGSAYITGLTDKMWKNDMDEEQCKSFVQKSVGHAMSRDASSGGCIRTVVINASGVKRDFLPGNEVINSTLMQDNCLMAT